MERSSKRKEFPQMPQTMFFRRSLNFLRGSSGAMFSVLLRAMQKPWDFAWAPASGGAPFFRKIQKFLGSSMVCLRADFSVSSKKKRIRAAGIPCFFRTEKSGVFPFVKRRQRVAGRTPRGTLPIPHPPPPPRPRPSFAHRRHLHLRLPETKDVS